MSTAAAAPPRMRARAGGSRVVHHLTGSLSGRIAFPLVCLGIWLLSLQVVTAIWPFTADVLPTPWKVASFMWDEATGNTLAPNNLYETFWISLRRLFVGMAIAMVVGTVIGLGMGLSRGVNAFFNDWVVAILAMPNLAWALFGSLAFGFGQTGPIVTVVLTGVPYVIINIREGVRNAPTDLTHMARAFGVPRSRVIRHVVLPSLMPFMFAAGRYAFALGWKGLVVAEVFGGQDGAGWTIKFWYDAHRAHGVIGYALFFVLFALIFEKFLFDRLSDRFFRWRPSQHANDVVEENFAAPPTPAMVAAGAASSTNSAALESIHQLTAGAPTRTQGNDQMRRGHDG